MQETIVEGAHIGQYVVMLQVMSITIKHGINFFSSVLITSEIL